MTRNSKPGKYRADQVGSLLRPQELLGARAAHAAGRLDEEGLRAAEDAAIRDVVRLQEQAGLDVVTDGEFRRSSFRSGFGAAVDGLASSMGTTIWHGPTGDKEVPVETIYVESALRQKRRIAAHEAKFLLEIASAPVKVTLISPGNMATRLFKSGAAPCYPTVRDLARDIAAITRGEIEALIAEGVDYIQLDNPGYTVFVDKKGRESLKARGEDPDQGLEDMIVADVAALEGITRPGGVCIGLHICRGNKASSWMNEGDYAPIAERLFSTLPFDRFLLEFDDERSGGFEPLRYVPKGKTIVLGMVSTKTPVLEDVDTLLRRIDEAAKFVDADHLAISPQCGFASVAESGNNLTIDEQRRKLELTSLVARRYWSD